MSGLSVEAGTLWCPWDREGARLIIIIHRKKSQRWDVNTSLYWSCKAQDFLGPSLFKYKPSALPCCIQISNFLCEWFWHFLFSNRQTKLVAVEEALHSHLSATSSQSSNPCNGASTLQFLLCASAALCCHVTCLYFWERAWWPSSPLWIWAWRLNPTLFSQFTVYPHKGVSWMTHKLKEALNEDGDWVIPRDSEAPFYPCFMKLVYIWTNKEFVTFKKMCMAQKEGLEEFWVFCR